MQSFVLPIETLARTSSFSVKALAMGRQKVFMWLASLDDDMEIEVATGVADNSKAMAGSPQSMFCEWSASSNKGISNGPSLVASPPMFSLLEQGERRRTLLICSTRQWGEW